MKKILSLILALSMAVLPVLSLAEDTAETTMQLEGFVTEIVDGGFLMEDIDNGEIMINTSDATVWGGLLTEAELTVGQYVIVDFDGRMTFSLPPQAHADRVGCYVLEGVISEVMEDGFMLSGDPIHGDVIVRTETPLAQIYLNVPVMVYYDGVMALSLPGQAAAKHIVIPSLEGTVSELTEEGFVLTDAQGNPYQVLFSADTLISELLPEIEEEIILEDAEEITVSSEEEQADAILEEENEEPVDEETVIELADGDQVTVYFNGAMTRSLPPQLTALEVVIHR